MPAEVEAGLGELGGRGAEVALDPRVPWRQQLQLRQALCHRVPPLLRMTVEGDVLKWFVAIRPRAACACHVLIWLGNACQMSWLVRIVRMGPDASTSTSNGAPKWPAD
mmetsp:Transcript_81344/g.204667  ORF Transcript_81344/g.204667 Transcript_81344/m.204667 type:complete len:108 (+) Transcript_81344:1463-1786(+)